MINIQGFTHSSRPETREPAARLVGILAGQIDHPKFITLAEQILQETTSDNFGVQHGAVATLGHVVGNCLRTDYIESIDQSTTVLMKNLVRRAIRQLGMCMCVFLVC